MHNMCIFFSYFMQIMKTFHFLINLYVHAVVNKYIFLHKQIVILGKIIQKELNMFEKVTIIT